MDKMIESFGISSFLLSKNILLIILSCFIILISIVTAVLFYHWNKYLEDVDPKFLIVEIVFIVGVVFFTMFSISFYLYI